MTTKGPRCVIDIGTTEIRLVIGSYNPLEDKYLLLKCVKVPSEGIRDGKIVHVEKLSEKINECVNKAGEDLNIKINMCDVIINARGTKFIKNKARIIFYDKNGNIITKKIEEEDIEKLIKRAKEVNYPENYEIIDFFISDYTINEGEEVDYPLGMHSRDLSMEVVFVLMEKTKVKNIYSVFENTEIDIKNIIIQPLAISQFLLSNDDKLYGTLLINIGESSTDFVLYNKNKIKCIDNFKVGGELFTKDLMDAISVEKKIAIEIKTKYANLDSSKYASNQIEIDYEGEKRSVETIALTEVLAARAIDIFRYIDEKFKRECQHFKDVKFIVISGGSSRIRSLKEFASEKMKVTVKRNIEAVEKVTLEGEDESVDYSFYTAIGGIGISYEKDKLSPESEKKTFLNTLWEKYIKKIFSKINF